MFEVDVKNVTEKEQEEEQEKQDQLRFGVLMKLTSKSSELYFLDRQMYIYLVN